ncbi:MAG: HIG1 domain-containing protein [Hyphomonadaceae bacterium]|nr:HIG1 domain-containing protein [Hyphomonadaceae bacterium]MBC6411435.1 HIG1 domain-containing protein [Hyphomonadaceae bacterium]
MLPILYALLVLSFAAVLITLVMGGRALTRPGDTNRYLSNKWMWRRIYAQGAALVLLLITLMVKKNGG